MNRNLKHPLFLLACFVFLIYCNHRQPDKMRLITITDHTKQVQKDSAQKVQEGKFKLQHELISKLINKTRLDTLLDKITQQQKVKVIARLKETWDDKEQVYQYSDGNYSFKLKIVPTKPGQRARDVTTIFYDGQSKINFEDYTTTCFNKKECEEYGFNVDNSLKDPLIVEVCGRQFLYSDVRFDCNGMGCGCVITMIYDLATKKPTFLENYRIPYEGFFLSDFNNDNNPDLLVLDSFEKEVLEGFDLDAVKLHLYSFKYSNGKFVPDSNYQYLRPIAYKLYTIGEHYNYLRLAYSVVENHWHK
jgi:hypothetical protein